MAKNWWEEGATPVESADAGGDWWKKGTTPASEKPKGPGAIRKAGDLAVGLVGGAVGATKALTDVAGAGNPASNFLDSANKDIDSLLSPQAQADKQEQSAIMKEAEGKGTYEGVKAGLKAFAVAPVQTTMSGLGSVIPVAAATMATGGGAIPAMAAGAATGAAMGAGTVKGAIYDDIKERSLAAGMTPEAAEAAATKAQSYGGGNTDQIALGAGLGMLDAATGVTPIVANMARKAVGREAVQALTTNTGKGLLRRTATGALEEMPLEAAQGGQEQLAANLAAQRAGYQAGTWDNVASNATLEGLASAGPGAGFGALSGGQKPATPSPAPPAPQEPPAPQTEPGAPQLGYNPMAGTHTVFPDGSIVLNSESSNGAKTVRDMQRANRLENAADPFFGDPAPVKPSEAMGLAPTAGPSLSNAAILSVDSGIHQAATEAADPYNAPLSALGQELSRTNQRLRQEADALGLDTEGLHGDAARMTDGKPHEDYLMAANDQLRKAMKAAKEIPYEGQRSGSDDPAPGGEAKGPDAQAGEAPAGDAAGAVRAGAVRPATDRVGEHGQRTAGTDGPGLPGAVGNGADTVSRISQARKMVGESELMRRAKALANDPRLINKGAEVGGVPADAVAMEAAARATVSGYWVEPPASDIKQQETATSTPAAPAAGLPAAGSATVQAAGVKGGFDPVAFDKERDDRIKASKAAGNKHLDDLPAYVESMRGKSVYYAHDPKVVGVVRTVDNRGNVYVNWSDDYSAQKELASPVKDGKKTVMQTSLGPRDLKDYVVGRPPKQPAKPQGTTANAPQPAQPGTQASQAPSAQGASQAVGGTSAPTASVAQTSQEKQKALDRIASGKAWFGSGPKAQQFIAQNGLKDTHSVKKTNATRFDVVANETKPVTQGATSEPQADQAQQAEAQRPQEQPAAAGPVATAAANPKIKAALDKKNDLDAQVAALNDELDRQGAVQNARTRDRRDAIRKQIAERDFPEIFKAVDGDIGAAEDLNRAFQYAGDEPKAKTIERILKKRGITPEYQKRWSERLLEGQQDELDAEMQGYEAGLTAQTRADDVQGLIDAAKKQEKEPAPGTRINGPVERAAADRLEKLVGVMPATMKPRAHSARAQVKGIIEQLRKDKTAVGVIPMLETASQKFMADGHAPFSEVIDEVIESLNAGEKPAPSVALTNPVTKAGEPTAEQIAAIGDITIDVPTENGTAKMTVNATKALASIDERLDALKMVQRCLA